jgi:hypothetical protein
VIARALSSAIDGWKADTSSYDGEKLQSLLEGLAPNFRTHLKEEVEDLSRDKLEGKVTSQELKDCISKLEEEVKKGDPFVAPVFMMSHTPPEHKVSESPSCPSPLSLLIFCLSCTSSTGQTWAGSCIVSSSPPCLTATQGEEGLQRCISTFSDHTLSFFTDTGSTLRNRSTCSEAQAGMD